MCARNLPHASNSTTRLRIDVRWGGYRALVDRVVGAPGFSNLGEGSVLSPELCFLFVVLSLYTHIFASNPVTPPTRRRAHGGLRAIFRVPGYTVQYFIFRAAVRGSNPVLVTVSSIPGVTTVRHRCTL